jgi:hypothetical protein
MTEGQLSETWDKGTQHALRPHRTSEPSADRRRRVGPRLSLLSLSPAYKRSHQPKLPPFYQIFPNAEVSCRHPVAAG